MGFDHYWAGYSFNHISYNAFYYTDDENGQEEVHSWFAGFYPYDSPQYVIVVFSEEGTGGGPTCGPVFQTIANALWEEHLVTRSPENMGSTG